MQVHITSYFNVLEQSNDYFPAVVCLELVLSKTVDVDWKYGMSGKDNAVCVSPGGEDYQSSHEDEPLILHY